MELISSMPGTDVEKQYQLIKAFTSKAKEIQAPPADQLVAIATHVAMLAQSSPDPEGLLMMFVIQIEEARKAHKFIVGANDPEECTKCGQCGKEFDETGNLISDPMDKHKMDEIIEQAMSVGIFNPPKKIES